MNDRIRSLFFIAVAVQIHVIASSPADLCIGVPTAFRQDYDVISRIEQIKAEIDGGVQILVCQSQSVSDRVNDTRTLRKMGALVYSNHEGYPRLLSSPLPRTHGDSEARVQWRSHEALDYVKCLHHCIKRNPRYIVILQDDVEVASQFSRKVLERLNAIPSDFHFATLFSDRPAPKIYPSDGIIDIGGSSLQKCRVIAGTQGVVFSVDFAKRFVVHGVQHFSDDPVDWLLGNFGCQQPVRRMYEFFPNLVQHRKSVSTFAVNGIRNFFSKTYQYNATA